MALRFEGSATDAHRGRLLGETRIGYVLIEAARLRCEILAEQCGTDMLLSETHRAIGLAGYHASSNFASELREQSLIEARCRCQTMVCPEPQQALKTVLDDVLLACDAFAYASVHTSDADVHTAHTYALSAAEQLGSALGDTMFR